LPTTLLDIQQIGLSEDDRFIDLATAESKLAFKPLSLEWMFHDAFASASRRRRPLDRAAVEGILSNKGPLPLLWKCFRDTRTCCGLFRG